MIGTIAATITSAYVLQAQSTTVLSTGAVAVASGTAITGTYVSSTYAWSLTNLGTITAPDLFTSGRGTGVYLDGVGDQITNMAGGVIDGRYAVKFGRSGASVVNYGVIGPTTFIHNYFYPNSVMGVSLTNGGAVTNYAGGTIAGYFGVRAEHGSATVTNAGAILGFGSADGVDLRMGGEVINQAGGTIAGIRLGETEYGVYITGGAATVTNAGTIAGGIFAAVRLASGYNDLLVVDPGATFDGLVNGGNRVGTSNISVLELAVGESPGTLGSTDISAGPVLGSQFINFASIAVDADASWTLLGESTIEAGVTLTDSSGALLVSTGTLSNYGRIELDDSTMRLAGLIGATPFPLGGTATLGAGSTLEVQGSLASDQQITFGGRGAYLHLDAPDSAHGVVTNFDIGETIDLQGVSADSVTLSDGSLSFSGGSFPLALANANTIQALPSGDGAAVSVLCFRADTLIQTPSGEIAVQDLAVGNAVLTQSGGSRRIMEFAIGRSTHPRLAGTALVKWIGHRHIDCRRHPRPHKVWPVRVRSGAFDDRMPRRDLWLSPDHAVYVAEVLIPIKHLINGTSIEQVPTDEVTYYHIELPEHDVLLAEGLPVESYLDTGDRFNFENGGGPIALHPHFSARRWDIALIWEALGCARLIVTGPELDAARQLVNARAAALWHQRARGHLRMPNDRLFLS